VILQTSRADPTPWDRLTCIRYHRPNQQLLLFYNSGGCFVNFPIRGGYYAKSLAKSLNTLVIYNSGANSVVNNY
jgi:hypothetical protein